MCLRVFVFLANAIFPKCPLIRPCILRCKHWKGNALSSLPTPRTAWLVWSLCRCYSIRPWRHIFMAASAATGVRTDFYSSHPVCMYASPGRTPYLASFCTLNVMSSKIVHRLLRVQSKYLFRLSQTQRTILQARIGKCALFIKWEYQMLNDAVLEVGIVSVECNK